MARFCAILAAMGESSTLRRVVAAQLRGQQIDLRQLLEAYPSRSFDAITQEIFERTGIPISSRTVRRWATKEAM